jgi:CRP-like cAMP-binding protein
MMAALKRRVGLVERLLALRGLPALAELPDGELAVIAHHTRVMSFRAGDVLLFEGQPLERLYVPVEGRITVTRAGGAPMRAERAVGGGTLGVLAGIRGAVRAVAETDALCLVLSADELLDILEDDFQIMARLLRRFALDMTSELRRFPRDRVVPESPPTSTLPRGAGGLDLVERIFFMRMSPAFASASLDGLAQFAKLLEQVTFGEGVTIWNEGDESDGMLLVVSGSVRCSHTRGSAHTRYGPTGLLGGIDVLADQPRWSTAVTETPFTALKADREMLLDVMEDNFDLARTFLSMMARTVLELREAAEGEAG